MMAARKTRTPKAPPATVRRGRARPGAAAHRKALRILSIDIGGTGLKAALVGTDGALLSEKARIKTPYPCPPPVMIEALAGLTAQFSAFDRIAIGFPGVVRADRVLTAPHFGTREWAGFPLGRVLSAQLGGAPARVINDAEMQGLSVIAQKGLELVLTLGTGAGTALFRDGELMPHLELAHHPVHNDKTYNEYIGNHALKKAGPKRWNKRVRKVIAILHTLLNYDHLFIGGGNARKIAFAPPDNVNLVSNEAGLEGGGALWRQQSSREATA